MRLLRSMAPLVLCFAFACDDAESSGDLLSRDDLSSPGDLASSCPPIPYDTGVCHDLVTQADAWVASHASCQVDADCGTASYAFMWNSRTCKTGPADSVSCSGYVLSKDGVDHLNGLFSEMYQQRCEGKGVCTGQVLTPKCCKNVCVPDYSSC
jgi:hypothetical protein